jgi:hypothetical protein
LDSYLMKYLRRVHTVAWVELGRPSMPPEQATFQFVRSWFLTFVFICSNRYKNLEDTRLSALILLGRAFLALLVFLMLPLIWYRH